MGGDTPKLKSCFKDEAHALQVFEKELVQNLHELQKHGLFFSFSTDPMLDEIIDLTYKAVSMCVKNYVPVKILTKRAEWVYQLRVSPDTESFPLTKLVSFGFTLTGRDDLEPNASTNAERIEAMRKLHEVGFKTWCSVEPVIDIKSSREVIKTTNGICDLYKIGLLSNKTFDRLDLRHFVVMVSNFTNAKIYFKDSLLKTAGIDRKDLPSNCIGRGYLLFNN
jgi:hypothetical protein